jgi:hypothetical protein
LIDVFGIVDPVACSRRLDRVENSRSSRWLGGEVAILLESRSILVGLKSIARGFNCSVACVITLHESRSSQYPLMAHTGEENEVDSYL